MLFWLQVSWIWNTIQSCWSKQWHDHRNLWKKLPKIRSGFLDSPPMLSHAYLDYLKLELLARKINIIFTESYKSLFVSCQTSFMWTFLCSSAWFSFEIICFTQFWGNLKCSTKHCTTCCGAPSILRSWHSPSPKENEPQLSLLSPGVWAPFPSCVMPPQIFISSSSNFQIFLILEF